MMHRGCCGHPKRRRRAPESVHLPPNPRVTGGVRLLFVGVDAHHFEGTATGETYHVSPGRRFLTVHPEDAPSLLRLRDVVLAPLSAT